MIENDDSQNRSKLITDKHAGHQFSADSMALASKAKSLCKLLHRCCIAKTTGYIHDMSFQLFPQGKSLAKTTNKALYIFLLL